MRETIAKLRGVVYRAACGLFRKNVVIGRGLKIYKKLRIEGPGRVSIGVDCIIDGIRGDSSQYVSIDTHSPDAAITIGDNVALYAARISSKFSITIGNGAVIEEAGVVDTDFHHVDRGRGEPTSETAEKCRIDIGDNVFIGSRSVVMKGARIGSNARIHPGAVVTLPVQPGASVIGNPARAMPSRP